MLLIQRPQLSWLSHSAPLPHKRLRGPGFNSGPSDLSSSSAKARHGKSFDSQCSQDHLTSTRFVQYPFFLSWIKTYFLPIPMQIYNKINNSFPFGGVEGWGAFQFVIWLNITSKNRHIIKTQNSWLLHSRICHKRLQMTACLWITPAQQFLKGGITKRNCSN